MKIGAPAKVVISGGSRCDTLRACFDMTYQGIQAGAAGVTYGRNIWQHEYPAAVIDLAMKIASDCAGCHLE